MSLVPAYRAFRANLRGYTEVSFEEFRNRIIPLRRRRDAWPDGSAEYIRALADAGAGFALSRLFGPRHPAAAAVLGPDEIEPPPMTWAELDGHMRALVRRCLADGWPARRFLDYGAYLDSDLTPAQMAARERAIAEREAGAPQPEPAAAPERDLFAEMYRPAGPAVKRVVREHLAMAAGAEARAAVAAEAAIARARDAMQAAADLRARAARELEIPPHGS